MLGYKEGHVLELFKNTFPTICNYLLFGIQKLREAVESAKRGISMNNWIIHYQVQASPHTCPLNTPLSNEQNSHVC